MNILREDTLAHIEALIVEHGGNDDLAQYLIEAHNAIDQESCHTTGDDEECGCEIEDETEREKLTGAQMLVYQNALAHVAEQTPEVV